MARRPPLAGAPWWETTQKVARVAMEVFRYVWSTSLLLFSLGVIIYTMVIGQSSFYAGVPSYVQIILLFALLLLLGTMEGTMIALTQLRKVDPALYKDKFIAHSLVQYATQGNRIERFLNGRQVIVVLCGFQLAYLTTTKPGGLPFLGQFSTALFETGLLGSFVVLILGQITPQTFAAKFPTVFLSNPILPVVVRLCLLIEFTGLTYATWAICRLIVYAAGGKWKQDVSDTKDVEDEEDQKEERLALFEPLRRYLNASRDASASNSEIELDVVEQEASENLPVLVGEKLYASAKMLAASMDDAGLWALSFLQPRSDPSYVPPHVVAAALLAENKRLEAVLGNARSYVRE